MTKSSSAKDNFFALYVKYLLSTEKNSLQVLKTLKRASFRTSAFPVTYLRYFDLPNNCEYYLPQLDFSILNFVSEKHEKVTLEYAELISLPNSR